MVAISCIGEGREEGGEVRVSHVPGEETRVGEPALVEVVGAAAWELVAAVIFFLTR